MEKGTFSINKTTVECYKIRHSSGMYWADITIDAAPGKGRIMIASDYGDYQYFWGACGEDFKAFLAKLDIYYTAGKFGCNQWFDVDASVAAIKKYVRECRLSKEEMKVIGPQIQELEDYIHEQEFISEFYARKELSRLFEYPEIIKDITPQFKKFWQHVWPVLLGELEKEKVIETAI
jgi:hypothetical protein